MTCATAPRQSPALTKRATKAYRAADNLDQPSPRIQALAAFMSLIRVMEICEET